MAEIGVMKKLTIGGKTYTIPEYSLPIASASTLGGVRVGTGLVIESGTGILSATGTDVTIDSEMSSSSTNPVQNQVIKAYVDQYKGTVTSVRVQATSPVQSSTSTAQSSSLNTTISLADGYGDTKNPYGTKTANYVLAGPTSGNAAAPSFRKLVAADIPDLSSTYLTSSDISDKADTFHVVVGDQISGDYYSINKTYTEILTAAWSGKFITCADMDFSYPYIGIAAINNATVIAFGISATYNGTAYLDGYMILSNNVAMRVSSTSTIPTKMSDLTNDAGYITSYTDNKVSQSASTSNTAQPILFRNNVSSGASSSTEGVKYVNTVTVTPSTGDITATKFNGYILAAASAKGVDTSISAASTSSNLPTSAAVASFVEGKGYITSADVPEGASAYTGTISAVGTTASNGTNNGFARGDHVHNITSSTITTALGYTPYNSTNPNGYISSYTDEKLKWEQTTVQGTFYPLQGTSTETTSTANTINGVNFYQYYNTAGGYRRLNLGNSTAYKSTGGAYGTIRLYGAAATYYGDLVPGVLGTTSGDGHISANRTWTLPDKTGTIALTSDIPTTLPASDVSAWAKASSKPTYTASEVGALASDTTYVSTVTTTAGTHTAISNKSGAVSFNVPTKTSHLTNDSGFITSDSDENVKSTTVTAATTNYIVGSTSSSTATGGLSKHASALIYTTADSGTSGYAELRLGNTTATSSAGGKEGVIRLYGSSTSYTDLKVGASTSAKTITFPDKTGTVALTSDIPTVPTKTSDLTNDSGFITSDTKVSIESVNPETSTTYYPTVYTNYTATSKTLMGNQYTRYWINQGTASAEGFNWLGLGNNTAKGTAGNQTGALRLYGAGGGYGNLYYDAEATTAAAHYLPSTPGTILNTGTTSFTQTLTSGTEVGTIKINGVDTKLYAPTNTDTKVSITAVTPSSSTNYYPTFYTASSGTSVGLNANAYTKITISHGSTSSVGVSQLQLGNTTAEGTANNVRGWLTLYSSGSGYASLGYISSTTANSTHYLPATGGTILNSGTTSFTQSLTSGTEVGTIKINGTSTKLYAPTNTDSKVLQSASTTDGWRKILLHYDYQSDKAAAVSSATEQVRASQYASIRPLDGSLYLGGTLTSSRINSLITGGTQTAAVTTSPYKPALWKFDAGITPANGDVVFIQAPGAGHSYGEFLSLDNGTTYKPITHSGTGKMTTHYGNGSPIMLVYDSDWSATSMYPLAGGTSTGTITGGAWRVINGYLDGNTYTQAYCTTAAATAAKVASMSSYSATAHRYVMVTMVYANTAASAITLNINGTGAKPIYINGAASSTSNYTLPAGSYLVYYNGTNYYFRTDGYMTVNYTVQAPSSETTFMPVLARSGVDIVNRIHEYTRFWIKAGSTSADGYVYLGLGNNTATGTNANSFGCLRLYSVNTGYGNLRYTSSTANTDHYLPTTSGTILNTNYAYLTLGTSEELYTAINSLGWTSDVIS